MATQRKTERILNLTICLLVSGRYLPKSRIREAVEAYHDLSDAAFERTFERDKDELRSLGVPIEVGSFDPLFDDEPGYRISPAEFELPPIELDADEAAVVGVAARVWQHASMAESTRSALSKLRAAGVEPDASQLASLEPSVQATEPAFEPLWTAVLERARVSFSYREGVRRTLEPWGMTSSKGRWYVIGWDTDRQAERMFKLSRMTDLPKRVSRPARTRCPPTSICVPWRDLSLRRSPPSRPWWPYDRARVRPCVAAASPQTRTSATPCPPASRCSGSATATCGPWSRRSPATPPTCWCSIRPSCATPCWPRCAGWRRWPRTSRKGIDEANLVTATTAGPGGEASGDDLPGPGAAAAQPGALPA